MIKRSLSRTDPCRAHRPASSITGLMQRLANHFAYCLSLLLSKMDRIYWKWAANPEVLPYFFSTMLRKQRIFPVSRVLSQRA
jgi:hypothetical protein